MKKQNVTNPLIGEELEFTLKNKQLLKGVFLKEFIYKKTGVKYFYVKSDTGKKYYVNPKNVIK